MRYEIFLDNTRMEELESMNDEEAIKKYNEFLEEFKGEEVYDTIELFKLESIKKESLETKEEEVKNG